MLVKNCNLIFHVQERCTNKILQCMLCLILIFSFCILCSHLLNLPCLSVYVNFIILFYRVQVWLFILINFLSLNWINYLKLIANIKFNGKIWMLALEWEIKQDSEISIIFLLYYWIYGQYNYKIEIIDTNMLSNKEGLC